MVAMLTKQSAPAECLFRRVRRYMTGKLNAARSITRQGPTYFLRVFLVIPQLDPPHPSLQPRLDLADRLDVWRTPSEDLR